MNELQAEALKLHKDNKGKLEVCSKVVIKDARDLSLAYSPGVAEPCKEIYQNEKEVYIYTNKGNCVAVVTDGSAVLGLGNIGPKAALPVMEGKAVLFKNFAGIDAFPICLQTTDVDKIVETVKLMEPTFGGVNLEDISAPRCFEIEERLKRELSIPIFHDDQHGTAIVVLSGLINALKLNGKLLSEITAVINGSGSAGIAIARLLINAGIANVIMCDLKGVVHKKADWLNKYQQEIALVTNKEDVTGTLANTIVNTDVFIGVSGPGALSKENIKVMAKKPIIFAMANPVPEIMPEDAKEAGAFIVATGRSDYPNQINNVLAFPGIFRGALDVQASKINEAMKVAAAYAIAELVSPEKLSPEYIIPSPFDSRVVREVAKAVAKAAIETGVAGGNIS